MNTSGSAKPEVLFYTPGDLTVTSKPMPLKKDNSHPEGIKKLGQSLHRDCPIRAHHWQKHSRPIACVLPGARASQNGLAGTVDSARCAKER